MSDEPQGRDSRCDFDGAASDRYDLEALRACLEPSPGAPEFPALAEAQRRSGHPEEAERIARIGLEHAPARMAGRVALALARLDLGDAEGARGELAGILEPLLAPYRVAPVPAAQASGLAPDLVADEIDQAIDQAEARPEEMISPNRMAERVLLEEIPPEEGEEDFDLVGSPTFRTSSMARLLERQGDLEGARGILRSLEDRGQRAPGGPDGPGEEAGHQQDRGRRRRIVATLERWLDNLQRGAA